MPRPALVVAAAAAIALSLAPLLSAAPDIVAVTGGRVSGLLTDGIRVFRGIPYAAPPVGARRWTPPQAVVPWRDVRDGSVYGPEC